MSKEPGGVPSPATVWRADAMNLDAFGEALVDEVETLLVDELPDAARLGAGFRQHVCRCCRDLTAAIQALRRAIAVRREVQDLPRRLARDREVSRKLQRDGGLSMSGYVFRAPEQRYGRGADS